MKLEIRTEKTGTGVLITLSGSLNTQTAPELEAKLPEISGGAVLDIGGLEYISSAGLRVLLSLQKRMDDSGGTLIVKNARPEVMEVLDMTGFSSILTLE